MRATAFQLGSMMFAAVGTVMIAMSLLSVSAVALANEPIPLIKNACASPAHCDELDKHNTPCAQGTCEAYGLDCNACCECLLNTVTNLWECQSNGKCD
jgi:hypothetical protein